MEQEIAEEVLDLAARFVSLEAETINNAINYHMQDQMKGYQMMALQQKIATDPVEDELVPEKKIVTKEDVMKAMKIKQDATLAQMPDMME